MPARSVTYRGFFHDLLGEPLESRHLWHAVNVVKEFIYLRDLQGATHALIHSRQSDRVAFFLMAHIGSHQCSDAGGVHVGDIGEVENEFGRTVR